MSIVLTHNSVKYQTKVIIICFYLGKCEMRLSVEWDCCSNVLFLIHLNGPHLYAHLLLSLLSPNQEYSDRSDGRFNTIYLNENLHCDESFIWYHDFCDSIGLGRSCMNSLCFMLCENSYRFLHYEKCFWWLLQIAMNHPTPWNDSSKATSNNLFWNIIWSMYCQRWIKYWLTDCCSN